MIKDYCPECNKSGVRYEHVPQHSHMVTEDDGHPHYVYDDTPEYRENNEHRTLNEKWCPRCKKWIKPYQQRVM